MKKQKGRRYKRFRSKNWKNGYSWLFKIIKELFKQKKKKEEDEESTIDEYIKKIIKIKNMIMKNYILNMN